MLEIQPTTKLRQLFYAGEAEIKPGNCLSQQRWFKSKLGHKAKPWGCGDEQYSKEEDSRVIISLSQLSQKLPRSVAAKGGPCLVGKSERASLRK